jgi:PKD repeat protein
MSQIGMHGSYLEGSVLDQLFGLQRQPGISAAQLLMEANDQDIPIYTITADNVNSIRPILNVGEDVQSDITNAIHAGKQVIVPQRELVHGNWKGAGYIIQDPVTGEGVYLLSGGLNGGGHETCFISVTPVVHPMSLTSQVTQQLLADAFLAFLYTYMSLIDQVISEAITDSDASEQMMTAFRVLEATVTTIVSPQVVKSGCLWIEANGIKRDELYVAFERDKQTGAYFKGVTVEFTSGMAKDCYGPSWDFGDGSPSVHYPGPIPHTYKKTGKYEVTLTAMCQTTSDGKTREQVEVKVDVYVSKVEMDVVEHHFPVNHIAQDDPRTDKTARNKLLVWSNPDKTISFDVVKQDAKSVIWIAVHMVPFMSDETPRDYHLDPMIFKKIEDDSKTLTLSDRLFPYNINEPYTNNWNFDTSTANLPLYKPDYIVKFGLDTNQSGSLEDEEVAGEYEIYSLTREDHELARDKFETLLGWKSTAFGVVTAVTNGNIFSGDFQTGNIRELDYALIYKHTYGVFPGGEYDPTSESHQIYSGRDYDKLTHKCGGDFQLESTTGKELNASGRVDDKDLLAVPDRNYPDGTVILPLYSYSTLKATDNSSKKAAEKVAKLVVDQLNFRKKIKAFFCDKNETEPEALKIRQTIPYIISRLEAVEVGDSKTIPLPAIYKGSYNAGARNGVGLGTADLDLRRIDLTVKKTAKTDGYDFVITGGTVWGFVKDIFDYNYFTGTDTTIAHDEISGEGCVPKLNVKKHKATASGATIQCGFGRLGAKARAGNVSCVVIELDQINFAFGTAVQIHASKGCLNPDPPSPKCPIK